MLVICLSLHCVTQVNSIFPPQLLTGPDRVVKGYGNTNHKDVNDELLGKLRVAILDYLQENLEFCKDKLNDPASEESEKNDVLKALTSIRHVIRGGKLDKDMNSVNGKWECNSPFDSTCCPFSFLLLNTSNPLDLLLALSSSLAAFDGCFVS